LRKDHPVKRIVVLATSALWVLATQSIASTPDRIKELNAAAIAQTTQHVIYDGSYRRITYPGGDVQADRGVCTDVIIRAYRAIGIDLQQRVHEDMQVAFAAYPRHWGMRQPDANIDHRRVPNLQTYFSRQQAQRAVTTNASDYQAGDIVTWMLPGNLPHIGIATMQRSVAGDRPLIVHNIGRGPQLEDMLFAYPITGRYRLLAQ
jgi:uncharacterized protein YijF (DUF1287 family)